MHPLPLQHRPATNSAPTPIAVLDEFLVAEEWTGLLDFAFNNAHRFVQSEVLRADGASKSDRKYRRSRVLFDLGEYDSLFSRRLKAFLPYVQWRLQRPLTNVSKLEIQLTATNHGEFFRAHTDNDATEVSGRQITFVYFFHREPRQFGGGELRIYDTTLDDGRAAAEVSYRVIYPMQNQVVFFPSDHLHEIVPVLCPSGNFGDSRFTVNGWYHR